MSSRRTKDMIITIFARFGGKFMNLLVFVLVARELTLTDVGIYGFVSATTLIFSTMLDMGVRTSLAVFVGADQQNASRYTHQSFLLWCALSFICLPAIYGSFYFSSIDVMHTRIIIPSVILLASMLYIRMMQGTLLGIGDITLINRIDLCSRVILFVFTGAFILLGKFDLMTALWTLCWSQVCAALYLFGAQFRLISEGRGGGFALARRLLSRGILFMLAVLAMNASKRLGFLVVSNSVNSHDGGLFFALQRVTEVMTEVGMAVSVVVFSHNVRAASQQEAALDTAHATRLTFVIFVLICIAFAASCHWSVPLLLGKKYAGHNDLFLLLLIGTLIGSVWTMLFPSLSVATSPVTLLFLMLPGLALNVASIYPLMSMFSLRGAALSLLLANIVLTFSFLFTYKRRFGVPMRDFLLPKPSDFSGVTATIKRRLAI